MAILSFPSHFISMHDVNREQIIDLFLSARLLASSDVAEMQNVLQTKMLGIMFFQPSTRTRLSFEAAVYKLGGNVSGFSDAKVTRSGDFYQESLADAVQVVSQFSDCIVIRHYDSNEIKQVTDLSSVPLINAGNGENEHPTQALSDLWTIYKTFDMSIDGIRVGLAGDSECRVMRSFIIGLAKFRIKKITFLLPPNKNISGKTLLFLEKKNIPWQTVSDIEDLLSESDVINMIPFYLSDFSISSNSDYRKPKRIKENYRLCKRKILKVGKHIPILHCGPRGMEIDTDIDTLPEMLYFDQIKDAVFMRMALIKKLLNQ